MADYNLVQEAISRGYSLDEIADKLSSSEGVDPSIVRSRGYSSQEILGGLGYTPPAPEKRSFGSDLYEIGRQVVGGAVTRAPGMVGSALEWWAPEGSEAERIGRVAKDYWKEKEKGWEPDLKGRGVIASTLIEGASQLAPSGLGMAAAALNPIAGGAFVAALFGGQQAQETYDKGIAAGISPAEATQAAYKTGLIEGFGETIADVAGAKLISGAGKALWGASKGVEGAAKAAMSPEWAARFAKDWAANAAIQSATEYAQGAGEAAVEKSYGIDTQDPNQAGIEGARVALGMSALLGIPTAIAHRSAGQNRAKIGQLLEDPAAPEELRIGAAKFVADDIKGDVGEEKAKGWLDQMSTAITSQQETKPAEPAPQQDFNPLPVEPDNTPPTPLSNTQTDITDPIKAVGVGDPSVGIDQAIAGFVASVNTPAIDAGGLVNAAPVNTEPATLIDQQVSGTNALQDEIRRIKETRDVGPTNAIPEPDGGTSLPIGGIDAAASVGIEPSAGNGLGTESAGVVNDDVRQAGEPGPAVPESALKQPLSEVGKIALENQKQAGWNNDWPFIPADLLAADFRQLIANDPSISAQEKAQIFDAGKKLGVVPTDEAPLQPATPTFTHTQNKSGNVTVNGDPAEIRAAFTGLKGVTVFADGKPAGVMFTVPDSPAVLERLKPISQPTENPSVTTPPVAQQTSKEGQAPQPAAAVTTKPAAGAGAAVSNEAPAVAAGGFDSVAWNKARDDRIKASRQSGAIHLDKVEPAVETMRGREIYNVHDPKERGVVRTVDNYGNVYVQWSDEYSGQHNSASETEEPNKLWLKGRAKAQPIWSKEKNGKTFVLQTSLGPTDLKDYVFSDTTKAKGSSLSSAIQTATPGIAQPAAQPLTARQAALAGEIERAKAKTEAAKAARGENAKPVVLSVGRMQNSAEPVTVKNGVIHIGKYPAQNFDTGEDVAIKANATPQEIAQALRDSGAIGPHSRIFGLDKPKPIIAIPVSQRAATQEQIEPQPDLGHIGRNNTPLLDGGKPFKAKADAQTAKKQQPMMRVLKVDGGFVLAPKTEAQIKASEAAAKRLSIARTGQLGVPIAAHEFIAGEGGLNPSVRSDLGVEGNPRIGNRRLYARAGTGLTLEQATQKLLQDGYLKEGQSQNEALTLIKRSLTQPQYTPEGTERMAEAQQAQEYQDHLAVEQEAAQNDAFDDPFSPMLDIGFEPDDFNVPGYSESSDPIKVEVNALLSLAESKGIDIESIKETGYESTKNGSEQDYYEALRASLTKAIEGSTRSGGENSGETGNAGEQGLTSPTRQDVLDQQARQENAAALDNKAQIDKESAGQTLTRQVAPEQRRDTSGDMFAQEKAQAEIDKRNSSGTVSTEPDLFAKPADPIAAPAKPASEMSASELLRAAADKMDGVKAKEGNPVPTKEQITQDIAGIQTYRGTLDLGKNQSPYMALDGNLTDPNRGHHQVAWPIMKTSDHPIHKFMDASGFIRIMGSESELNAETLNLPTDEQFAGLKRAAGDRPYHVDISGIDGKIIATVEARSIGELRREIESHFAQRKTPTQSAQPAAKAAGKIERTAVQIARDIGKAEPDTSVKDLIEQARQAIKDELGQKALDDMGTGSMMSADELTQALHDGQYDAVKEYAANMPVPVHESDIPRETANRAHSGTSYSPEKRGDSARRGYVRVMVDAWKQAERATRGDPEALARVTAAMRDLVDGYRSRYIASLEAHSRVMSSMIAGPANFPVASNRKKSDTADKRAGEAQDFLNKGITRMLKAARAPIDNSPDSELARVRANLEGREAQQARMKEINAAHAKFQRDPASLEKSGLSEQDQKLIREHKPRYSWEPHPFAPYELTNNNAEIRRLKDRLASAEQRIDEAAAGPVETTRQGVRIEENAQDDRLRLFFDEKPSEEIRADLKNNGFKWSPNAGAWQRQLTDNAKAVATRLMDKHFPETKPDSSLQSNMDQESYDPDPKEAERVQSEINGKTPTEVTRWLMQTGSASEKEIAGAVLKRLLLLQASGVKLAFKIAHVGDTVPSQLIYSRGITDYHFGSGKGKIDIWVNGSDVTGKVGVKNDTILHELVHGATMAAIRLGNMQISKGTKLAQDVGDLYAVHNVIAKHFNQRVADSKAGKTTLTQFENSFLHRANNAFSDVAETVSWALTDKDAQAYLEAIPYKSKSLWTAFVAAVRKALGLSESADTALSEVLRVSDALMGDNINEMVHAAHFSGTEMAVQQASDRWIASQTNRSLITGQTLQETWQAPDASKMDNFIYTMQDKHIDTKRVVKAIRDAIGAIADQQDPYLQEELFHNRAAMATKEFLEKQARPLLIDMQARGVEMSDFEEYLHNRHAERRNVQVAKVNPDMQDGGSGIDTADARAYLAGLSPAKDRSYKALAARIDQINRDTRALLVSSGLEKQETIDAWQAAYGDEYVPLMREEMENGMGIGQGFSVRGSASKRAMGSDKPVANILANIMLAREKAITRSEKRKIGEALYGLVLEAPNPNFWLAIDPALEQSPKQILATSLQLIDMGMNPADAESIAKEPTQRYINPKTGLVESRINPAMRSAENVLAVRIDGEDKYVFFNKSDERAVRMAKALKNLDADQLGQVMGTAAKMTRYFAAVNTQYNPVFGVTNIIRDVQTAMLNLQSTELKGKQKDVLKHILPALRGIYIDLRDHRQGKQPSSAYAQVFEEFQREGGATGYRDMYANAEERADSIRSEIAAISDGKAKQLGKGILNWLSDYNEAMENAVRVSAYMAAKQHGMSNQRAASLAKNLTVNFNRKGQAALQAGALFAFFNASVQGTARMGQTLFEGGKLSQVGKQIITGGLLLGGMQAMLLAMAGFDDDEPPDFVRERNLVIPIGDKKYITIPMPLGFHIIPNLARVPTEWAMGGFKNTPKRIGQLVGLFADGMNPIGSATFIQTLTPTILDPAVALAENKDWTGKPIAKKDFDSMHPTAGHTRSKDTATPWAKFISKAVNYATGGTEYKPGLSSPTPDQIDYVVGQITGGVGREVGKIAQVGGAAFTGDEIPLYKVPLIGRFVGTTEGQAAESSRFYENLKSIGVHKAEIDGLKHDHRGSEIGVYVRDNPEARMLPMASKFQDEVSKLNRRKHDLVKQGASAEKIKIINMQITAKMAQLNAQVRRMREAESAK